MTRTHSDVAEEPLVVCYPDPVLRKKARPVAEIDDEVRRRAEGMTATMYAAAGIGLAAPQVGWGVRIVVLNATGEPDDEGVFVNPCIVRSEGEVAEEEGCLSLPGLQAKVVRSAFVEVRAYGLDGEEASIEADGLAARAWQHEIDHLDGVLIIDRMGPAARLFHRRLLKELEAEYEQRADAAK